MKARVLVARIVMLLLLLIMSVALLVTLATAAGTEEIEDTGATGGEPPRAVPDIAKRRPLSTLSGMARATATYGVELSATITSATGTPGALVEFTLTVVNTGAARDSYNFTLMNSGTWSSTLAAPSVTLDPNVPYLLPVYVEVPAAAVPGDSNLLTVTARSIGDAGVSDDIELVATAVAPPPCEGCDPVYVETESATGSRTRTLTATHAITSLAEASGIIAPAIIDGSISQDPTRWDPFDDLGDHLFTISDTVPAGALRLVVEILASEAPDADLYVGFDDNGDGLPEAAEMRCGPFLPGSLEYCSFEEPQAGVWWVVVQASYASGEGSDPVQLAWAVIDGGDVDNDALDVAGPASVPAGQPFAIDLNYDLRSFNPEPGDVFYGGVSLGSEPGSPTDIDNIVPVDVRYLGGSPQIVVTPDAIDETVPLGEDSWRTLTISNTGGDRSLSWQIAADGRQPTALRSTHEIVRDGSFELGSPNPYWHEGGDFLPPLCSPGFCGLDLAHSAEWYAWFGGFGTTNTTWISQNLTIPNGQTALLSYYLYAIGNLDQEMAEFRVLIDGNPVAIYDEDNVADYLYGYERATVDISAYADGNTHELMFIYDEVSGTAFLDDVAIEVDAPLLCVVPETVPWLSLGAHDGTVAPGASAEVDVHFDAGDLTPGTYRATLCIASDDPHKSLHQVPVTLTIRHFSYLPAVFGVNE